MAKKVTVSIPDLLYEKMEQWRASFNLSKMLQEAVAEAIQKKEDFQKRLREDLDLNQIIERLRQEKRQSEGDYHETGRQDGLNWAKSAHYDDLIYAINWEAFEEAEDDPVLGPYFAEKKVARRPRPSEGQASPNLFRLYLSGWQSGVGQFWEEVREKI